MRDIDFKIIVVSLLTIIVLFLLVTSFQKTGRYQIVFSRIGPFLYRVDTVTGETQTFFISIGKHTLVEKMNIPKWNSSKEENMEIFHPIQPEPDEKP